jgi:gliding motility-associated-like protein
LPITSNASLFAKRILLLFAFLLLALVKGYGQQFYVATSSGTLERVTITSNGLISVPVGGCGYGSFYSIAILGSKIYYTTGGGSVYSGDITGGASPTISNCTYITIGLYGNALTIDKQGTLYAANFSQIYSLAPNSATPVYLGNMPFSSGGDLIFYKDELYLAGNGGIIKVSLTNPANSTMYIPISGAIWGLTVASINGVNKVYAFVESTIYELDMENRTKKGLIGTLPYTPYDAASEVEAGAVPTIEIDKVNIIQECNVFNKGHVEVITKTHTSQYTYTLNTGQSNQTGVFDNLAPGTYTLTITSNGIESSNISDITVPDYTTSNPVITPAITNPVCDIKGHIKLDAGTANATYSIRYNGQVFTFDHTFTDLSVGSYHFTILKPNGCIADEKDYALTQDDCPPITINNVQVEPECNAYGQASVKVITQAHPDNYTYTLNGTTNTTGVFNFLTPGSYSLVVVSSGGDMKEQEVTVPDYTLNKPDITYTVKSAVCTLLGEIKFTINGDSKGATKVKFGTGVYSINQIVKGLYPGTNHFAILNQQECILDEFDVDVIQDKCEPVVFPNAFTPNGDNINDLFRPNQDSSPLNYKLVIYNRFGNVLFQARSIYNGWDGNYNGKPLPYGVYYWVATYTMGDGKGNEQSGYVTLIR